MATAAACFTELEADNYIPAIPELGGDYEWGLNGDATRLIVEGEDW